MKAIHIEVPSGKELAAHEVGGGVVGFCSWRRLEEVFRDAKELKATEQLKSVQLDERGITYRVR